jgi:hypothetical protein
VKTYHLILEETNGEQEYTYHFLVYAKDKQEGNQVAVRHAKAFYSGNVEEIKDGDLSYFEFFGGQIVISIVSLEETTEKQYLEEVLARESIGKRPELQIFTAIMKGDLVELNRLLHNK